MIKKLILLLFLPAIIYGQSLKEYLFSAADTIGSVSTPDSVYMQFYDSGWELLTQCTADTSFITADDKAAEVTKIFMLAREDFWTYSGMLRFQVRNTGVDTITSSYVSIPATNNGALTLFMKPDTVGTNTFYGGSFIEGD
jgi:hypothetical protein